VGVYKWTSDAESTFVSRCGTVPTILCYSMELYKEYNDAFKKAKGDIKILKETLYERKWFILSKLLEYPI
jgi:hypothetical protein